MKYKTNTNAIKFFDKVSQNMNSLIRLQKYSFTHLSRIFFVTSDSQIESASNTFMNQDLNQGSKGKYINAIKILSNA
jgi:hypothetical protein